MQERDRQRNRQQADRLLEEMDRLEREITRVSPSPKPATRDENREKIRLYIEMGRVAEAHSQVWQYGLEARYQCPCCGLYTLEEDPPGTYDIRIVCWWEDDPIQCDDPDYWGGANNESLSDARASFRENGTRGPYWLLNPR